MSVTVITDEVRAVDGEVVGGRVLVEPASLVDAVGWQLKPEGLCRDDRCVPVRDLTAIEVGHQLDVAAVGATLGRRAVVDADGAVVALSLDAEGRRQALSGHRAPDFTLPDLDGRPRSLEEWHGRRRMLFAFSSW
ncbi:MAG: peroxiredoxin family protein [Acidimicrobiia bacterium]|nr:peroxiredoxin family protein [Acidimicrobiia bacterium]